jgi:hypothetical protein
MSKSIELAGSSTHKDTTSQSDIASDLEFPSMIQTQLQKFSDLSQSTRFDKCPLFNQTYPHPIASPA